MEARGEDPEQRSRALNCDQKVFVQPLCRPHRTDLLFILTLLIYRQNNHCAQLSRP